MTLLDQREYVAEVVRHDFTSGLGLIRIAEGGLPALPLRRSTDLRLGDEVFLVASAGEGSARISNGGVSYLGPFDANWEYVLERAIMTTAMNPGLGGGPLLDMQGDVVGIVSLNLNEIGRFSLAIPAEYYLDARDEFLAGGGRGMGDARVARRLLLRHEPSRRDRRRAAGRPRRHRGAQGRRRRARGRRPRRRAIAPRSTAISGAASPASR